MPQRKDEHRPEVWTDGGMRRKTLEPSNPRKSYPCEWMLASPPSAYVGQSWARKCRSSDACGQRKFFDCWCGYLHWSRCRLLHWTAKLHERFEKVLGKSKEFQIHFKAIWGTKVRDINMLLPKVQRTEPYSDLICSASQTPKSTLPVVPLDIKL